jgi:hypothetical protein
MPTEKVTPAMEAAGLQMASVLVDIQIAKDMYGLGGGSNYITYCKQVRKITNFDLAKRYVEGKIETVTAIYLAMQRAATTQDNP